MMMLNPSGGLVGGDRLRTSVEIGPDAAVVLTTASATKVYRTAGEAASHRTLIALREGAALEYLPDHVIPHTGSSLRQSMNIEMASGSRAIVYDAMAAGRIGRGERWEFREMASEIAIRRDGRPVYISRSRIIPKVQPLTQLGWMEEFNYLATVVIVSDSIAAWSSVLDEIDLALRQHPGVYSGVSELSAGGSVVRLMTRTAADLIVAKGKIWAIARRAVLGLEAFDLRK
jgi:urease accessory protein